MDDAPINDLLRIGIAAAIINRRGGTAIKLKRPVFDKPHLRQICDTTREAFYCSNISRNISVCYVLFSKKFAGDGGNMFATANLAAFGSAFVFVNAGPKDMSKG